MDVLNNENNLESIYSHIYDLVGIQLASLNIDHPVYEDLARDVSSYAVVEDKLHEKPRRTPYFWWNYLFSITSAKLQADYYSYEEMKEHLLLLSQDEEFPFTLDNTSRDYIKIKPRKLESHFRKGDIVVIEKLAEQLDITTRRSINYSIKDYIVKGKTEVLLKAYLKLASQRTRDFKTCRTKLNREFLREPPSKR